MIGGVRARLTATIVFLVVLTAVVLGVAAYLFVDARLHQQTLDEARDQARFDLSVLAPSRLPGNPPTEEEILSLLADFEFRNLPTILVPAGDQAYVSSAELDGVVNAIPADVRRYVDEGQVAYSWQPVAGRPSLIIGGRSAGTGPELYFVRDVGAIGRALDQLRLALAGGALVLALVAVVAARLVARGVLAPVDEAAHAAERIGRGDLSARVPVTSSDEFGRWADRFNRMADSLEDTILRLEAAQSQNRRFVADVAHELRTPVAALVAEASLLRGHLDAMPSDARRTSELVVGDIARLRDLVEDLMELSRFDADGEEVRLQPVDLRRLLRDVAAARHRDAVLELGDDRIVVDSEPRRLERILANLLDNAREHAPGAVVVVRLRTAPGEVAISVLDRGPGVPPDRLDRIFERFYMADPSRRGGSGLGLAIAAENARILGGELRARNRTGGGLEIELRLPVTEPLPDGDDGAIQGDDGEGR
ncbi:MAG TPA: HAMP domain-containing sensor histidine kinase [Candidatus Limnocylindrales bacterium]|nr:HAMP domain-containing sensor histidine kinase [Candidatus Limnocylindrales bacterium]